MIYLHELTPLTGDKRVLPGRRAELADLALAADQRVVNYLRLKAEASGLLPSRPHEMVGWLMLHPER